MFKQNLGQHITQLLKFNAAANDSDRKDIGISEHYAASNPGTFCMDGSCLGAYACCIRDRPAFPCDGLTMTIAAHGPISRAHVQVLCTI